MDYILTLGPTNSPTQQERPQLLSAPPLLLTLHLAPLCLPNHLPALHAVATLLIEPNLSLGRGSPESHWHIAQEGAATDLSLTQEGSA